MKSESDSAKQESRSTDKRSNLRIASSAAIFVVGFGLFIALLTNSHIMAAVNSDNEVQAEELATLSTSDTADKAENIAKNLGRLKYNGISVAVRDAGVTVDTNEHKALIAYVDETDGPDAVTLAAQRSRALATQIDKDAFKTVTVVATDGEGNVKAAVTNKTGADENAVATSDLLSQAQSYAVSPTLYSYITTPNYARTSSDPVQNVNSDDIKMDEKVEVTRNALNAGIDSKGKVTKIVDASSNDVAGTSPVQVVDAKAANDIDDKAKSSSSATVKTVASAAGAIVEPVDQD
jgi:hypothetical protein